MYRKVIGIVLVALLAVGAYSVTKANAAADNNVALEDLLKVNVANAECFLNGGPIFNGRCTNVNYPYYVCVTSFEGNVDCDRWEPD